MKNGILILLIVIVGLTYSCVGDKNSANSDSSVASSMGDTLIIAVDDTLSLPADTKSIAKISTDGWSVKEIRDSIERCFIIFSRKEYDNPRAKRAAMNMSSIWNSNDTIFVSLIAISEEHISDFKRYVFDSPLISITGGPSNMIPEGILCEDNSMFSMEVTPNVYPTDIKRIEITITNHTRSEATGGEDQYLQYFNGKDWEGVPQNNCWTSIGYPVSPGESRDDFSATLRPDIQNNKPGLYRVFKSLVVGSGKNLKEYLLCDSFRLSNNPEEYYEYTKFANSLYEPKFIAEFKGGNEAKRDFFKRNLQYPESHRGKGLKVELCCSFTIDSLGRVVDIASSRDNILRPNPLDENETYQAFRDEAFRVIKIMPAWNPAVNRKRGPVSSTSVISFIFEENNCRID